MRKILYAFAGFVLIGSLLSAPAAAAGTVGSIHSDTTKDLEMSVGERYCFSVTQQDKGGKISYSVGNGNILQTFAAGKPVKNKNGTTTYYFGFKCRKEGSAGIYIKAGGKSLRLFSVKVSNTIPFSEAIGKSSKKYSIVLIQHQNSRKAITDQKKIQSLLNNLAADKLKKRPQGSPVTSGWEYALYFYPTDGSGAYEFVDTGGFIKNAGCSAKGPTGAYIPEDPDSVRKILSAFYNQN